VIKTENLTILFVDIAGFTATTSRQSRAQNARLLQTFGSTLFPLIKHYKGRLIKTIGDALMLTFRSPTDAMLCAMALQDAMHAHNLSASDDEKIHIRVAANLGEVRVTKNDIFGEPVNVASRIEGVAPADEIYLSEAVYMAMNKAEVPSAEVGFTELKGISQAVRLYNIPRFSTPRLVAENASADEKGNEILYPYGGMHCQSHLGKVSEFFHFKDHENIKRLIIPAVIAVAVVAAVVIGLQYAHKTTPSQTPLMQEAKGATQESPESKTDVQQSAPAAPIIKKTGDNTLTSKTSSDIKEGQTLKPAAQASPALSSKAPETAPINPQPAAVKESGVSSGAPIKQSVTEPITSAEEESDEESADTAPAKSEPELNKTQAKALTSSQTGWNVIKAKESYKANKISKAEYAEVINKLKTDYRKKIVRLKEDYKAKKITRDEYENQVRKAKQDYNGR